MLLTFLFLFRLFECSTFGYRQGGIYQQFVNAVLNGLYHHYTRYNVAYDEAVPLLKNPNSLFSRLLASFKIRFEGHKKLTGYEPDVTIRDEIWTACVNKAREDGVATNVAGDKIFDILSEEDEIKYWIRDYSGSSTNECFLCYKKLPDTNSEQTIEFWILNSEVNRGSIYSFFMSTKNFKGETIWYDASHGTNGKEELNPPNNPLFHGGISENIYNYYRQLQKKLRLSGQAPPIFTDTHYTQSFSFDCPDKACLNKAKLFFGNNQIIHRKTKGIFHVRGIFKFPNGELDGFLLKAMFASFFVKKYDDIWTKTAPTDLIPTKLSDCNNFKIFIIANKAFEGKIPPNTSSILTEGRTADEIESWLRSEIGPNKNENNVCFVGFSDLEHPWIDSFHQLPINLICASS